MLDIAAALKAVGDGIKGIFDYAETAKNHQAEVARLFLGVCLLFFLESVEAIWGVSHRLGGLSGYCAL